MWAITGVVTGEYRQTDRQQSYLDVDGQTDRQTHSSPTWMYMDRQTAVLLGCRWTDRQTDRQQSYLDVDGQTDRQQSYLDVDGQTDSSPTWTDRHKPSNLLSVAGPEILSAF